jgi:glutaminyl-peptide cyclotransferase
VIHHRWALAAPRRVLAGALLGLAALGCPRTTPAPAPAPGRSPAVEDLVAKVVRSYPHDRQAFTQGLLYFDGKLYESTGLVGRSSLRRVELESGRPEKIVELEAPLFAEGLARVGGRLVQLTWQNGKALVWSLETWRRERELPYAGEGWGLCHDGRRLVMSDGSDRLTLRDPDSFAVVGHVGVRRAGSPLGSLNELECVGDVVYANVWQDEHLARIDLKTGEVTAWIDASGLLAPDERLGTDVLNGIAYVPETGRFLLTGKLWPRLFEVEFVPRPAAKGAGTR